MRVDITKQPKSSFLSMEKDLNLLVEKMLKDDILKKLLYYTDEDPLKKDDKHPNLTQEQSIGLLRNEIRLAPKITIDPEIKNYIIINFDNFSTNDTNPEFRDNAIIIDIICHLSQWYLPDFQLRPYRIAAEVDTIMSNTELTNMGKIEFVTGSQLILNDEFAGISMAYKVIHGGEDKVDAPVRNEDIMEQFNKLFNTKK